MSPFSVTVQNVPDRELGPLLTQLSAAGFDNPVFHRLRQYAAMPRLKNIPGCIVVTV